MKIKFYIALIMVPLLTSCSTIQTMIEKSTRAGLVSLENKQKEMEQRYSVEKENAVNEVIVSKDAVIKKQEDQLQSAANSLYGADLAYKAYSNPARLDIIINNRVTEASSVIKKSPTYEAMKEENLRLVKEMDETKTTLAQLQSEHEKVKKEKENIAKEKEDAVVKSNQASKDLENINKKHDAEAKALAEEIGNKKNEIIAQQDKQKEKDKELAHIKTKISTICGIISLLCLAGAVYSPVFKSKFALMAGIVGLCSIGIWFVEPWMVAVGFGVILIGILGFFAWEYHVADKTADNLVNHIQDIKENPDIPDDVKSIIKQSLKEWNSKYTGSKISKADDAVEKYIESKLKDYGRL